MFPHPHGSPAHPCKLLIDPAIPIPIAINLLGPVGLVRTGQLPAFRTAVPKAAVDKDSDALCRKGKVRSSGKVLKLPLPAPYPGPDEKSVQPEFRRAVSGRPNLSHDARAGLLGDAIHYLSCLR